MNDNIESGEDIVLLCLRSVDKDPINILQLRSVGISVYEFDDADEYVQYLLSVNQEDTFVFAWLGFGWNHLIATLDDFEQVYCIYLSEPTKKKRVTKVGGIFTDVVKLLQQVRLMLVSDNYISLHTWMCSTIKRYRLFTTRMEIPLVQCGHKRFYKPFFVCQVRPRTCTEKCSTKRIISTEIIQHNLLRLIIFNKITESKTL